MKSVDHKRPLKVFLCHAHADRDPVRGLYTRLTQDGVDAWLDKAKLLPGQDWELEIRKAVREADVVVVCLSKQFNQAGFRQKEVRLALDTAMEKPEGEIFIIPARLEECDNLESLRKWHWVDLYEDDGYEMLMRALRARADRIGATLQIKKNWLPIGNTQPAVVKKPSPPVEKPVEKKQEKPKPKKEIQTPRTFNKTIIGITGLVVLVLVAIFGLRPLIGKPEPTPTALPTFTASLSPTPLPTLTRTAVPTVTMTPIPPLVAPILVSPQNNSSCDRRIQETITLVWEPVIGATEYFVGVDCLNCCKTGSWCYDVNGQSPRTYITSNAYFIFEIPYSNKLRWHVHAINGLGDGPVSDWWYFDCSP